MYTVPGIWNLGISCGISEFPIRIQPEFRIPRIPDDYFRAYLLEYPHGRGKLGDVLFKLARRVNPVKYLFICSLVVLLSAQDTYSQISGKDMRSVMQAMNEGKDAKINYDNAIVLQIKDQKKLDEKESNSIKEQFEKCRLDQIASLMKEAKKRGPNAKAVASSLKKLRESKGNYIPEIEDFTVGNNGKFNKALKVSQVMADGNIIVTWADKTVILSGFKTGNITTDLYVKFDCPIRVTKTKTYNIAIGGSKTSVVVEPLNL